MKTMRQLIADWKTARGNMKELEQKIPRIIGSVAVRVVKNNFKLQGYDTGTGVQNWKPRSADTNKRYDKRYGVNGAVFQSTNPLLKQTGALYNGIQYKVSGKLVFIGVDLGLIPYAQKMNEGGKGKWGKNSTDTPARQFMPKANESPNAKILTAALKKITSERNKALKQFNS